MTRNFFKAAIGLCATLALSATANAQSLTAGSATVAENTLTVASVEVPQEGWLVVHTVQDGAAGPHIGHAQVTSGANENVEISLDQPALSGDQVILMLHEDTGTTGTFEFEGEAADTEDAPVMVEGQPAQVEVTLE